MATWRDLLRKLEIIEKAFPNHIEEAAMVRFGDALIECDLYRSLTTGRLMIDLAYQGRDVTPQEEIEPTERTDDADG